MGRAWRTPSPAKSDYVGFMVDTSPSSAPPLSTNRSDAVPMPNRAVWPSTPPAKRRMSNWHGLPSPHTPTSDKELYKTPLLSLEGSDQVDGRTGADVHATKVTEQALTTLSLPQESFHQVEGIACDHDESSIAVPVSTRRSTRARKHVVSYNLSPSAKSSADTRKVVKAKHVSAAPASHLSAPYELTITPAKVDPIPFEGLPALRSLDWDLQYPPGGSTHPSYPYPNLDPRLIFCQPFVPVIDGLPDFSKVPKLVLPIGWRQVSWSGLLPIVFDPYLQAFKLTPVGPLPLTCEELQQGGLQKYVPGGELHPETALLPDIMQLSDGSVDDVYNWEDVDWVLPWGDHENGDFAKSQTSSPGLASGFRSATGHDLLQITSSTISPAVDVWECPDNIVNLEEAWRWLAEYENRRGPLFEFSATKTWRGTGIHCVSRKIKQPIAGLMAITLADKSEDATSYLVNQNGREFCAFKSVATPVNVDITLLKDVEITLFELMVYFPNHYKWRKYADRVVRSGMSAADITNFINMTRSLGGEAIKNKSTINDHMYFETEAAGGRKRVRIQRSEEEMTTSHTVDGWGYDVWELSDYPLLGLAHGLQTLPVGPDAGPLTACIAWCRKNGRYHHMLSEVSELLKEIGIEPLIEPAEDGCPDKEVLGRHSDALRIDRKRVLREMRRLADEPAPSESRKKRAKVE